MKIQTGIFFVALLVLPMVSQAQGQCVKNEKGYLNISGEYLCTIYCPAEGLGGRAYVVQEGGVVKFINGHGDVAIGSMLPASKNIDISDWGLSAKVVNNCQELVFSNTTVWLRK
ncbi:MAG: hypothetical protein EPN21_03335 [Methylococcaceae bacterium]|nr:MAG: hypothetical protein EPN21_03335 [Methylococcaceae bacterium]